MAIYKYTLVKYLKAKSTWIIAFISGIVIGFLLGGLLPSTTIDVNSSSAATNYTLMVVSTIAGVTSFLSVFASVFAGFKAASMYKDEVEDGTFLVILSKPMRRSSIILFKWLALQTVIIGWVVFTVGCFMAGTAAFDKGNKIQGLEALGISTVSSQIPQIGGFVLLILFVTSLIFSSVGLLLSTKLSVGSTIGISIALGIIIPITSLIGIFVKSDPYKVLVNRELAIQERSYNELEQKLALIPGSAVAPVAAKINVFENTDAMTSIYKLGVATGKTNAYNYAWAIDLNYQFSLLSAFAYEKAIPEAAKEFAIEVKSGASNAPGQGGKKVAGVKSIKSAMADIANSAIVNNIANALHDYLPVGNQMAQTSIASLKLLLSGNLGVDVNGISLIDKTLLGTIGVKGKAANKIQWVQDLATNQATPINVQNVLDLLDFVYGNADYAKILDYSRYEQDPAAGQESDWLRYQINKIAKNLVTNLGTAALISPLPQINLKTFVKVFGDTIEKLNSPVLSFFVKGDDLKSSTTDILTKDFTYSDASNNVVHTTYENAARGALAQTPINPYIHMLPAKDIDAIVQLVSASLANKLDEVKAGDYVNKTWLMVAYAGIALALVPIAYLVIRRQDFR